PYTIEGRRASIGTSVGIAVAPYDGIESADLVKAADLALYAAKGGGRGQFRFYSNDLKENAEDRREIEEDLRDAIAREELEMRYQPQVDARQHTVQGFEALMRWEHPERGPISPAVFIPIAEDSNLIDQIGTWALMQSCRDAASWPGELPVAVNVSARQFMNDDLPDIVSRALSESGLPASRLELEITESVFVGDIGNAQDMFAKLKKIGVRLALDDFGTGYSSLSYLRQAPFDKIKIDQSFVRGCAADGQSGRAIISAITSLARAMDMTTVAEGVEAMDELKAIASLEVDKVQGFIFSRAVSHGDVLTKLESGELRYEPAGPAKHRDQRRTLFRRIGVVHEDNHYVAMLRDLSRTGARIEGILDVPIGTDLVIDLGEGQIVVGKVRRSQDATQGLEFELPLVSDGAGGLCTRHRVSPYMLANVGMPLQALPSGHHLAAAAAGGDATRSHRRFMQVDLGGGASRAG
ncbi:MAG: EAL domain-containing protein, partial [Alteraurantiacibacter sp.]